MGSVYLPATENDLFTSEVLKFIKEQRKLSRLFIYLFIFELFIYITQSEVYSILYETFIGTT